MAERVLSVECFALLVGLVGLLVASRGQARDVDCITKLINISSVTADNREAIADIFHEHELDQEIIYEMPNFEDVQTLLKSAGVMKYRDQFNLFRCLNKISAAINSPCYHESPCHSGVCTFRDDKYGCRCLPGYTGSVCDRELNECDLRQPCLNGATCVDHVNNFTCTCAPGFYGRHCETDRNECASSPCLHGTCMDVVNGHQCHCEPGYTGTVCDEEIDECASSPCQHGRCLDHHNMYSCQCHLGYTGYNCDVDIDDCASQPCESHATCQDKVNNFTCHCPLGFDGRRCDNLWLTKRGFEIIFENQKTLKATQAKVEGTQAEVIGMKESLGEAQSTLTSLNSSVSAISTAYTRWGRANCSNSSALLYTGYTAASRDTYTGGPSNPLCLHSSPRYNGYSDSVWGGIYVGAGYNLQGQNAPYSSSLNAKLAPCAVCAVQEKSTTVMIPARNDCPTGWTLEYHGYLMATHYTGKRSESLCFDSDIEGLESSATPGHRLYTVQAEHSFGLPTSYVSKRTLACVVCSR